VKELFKEPRLPSGEPLVVEGSTPCGQKKDLLKWIDLQANAQGEAGADILRKNSGWKQYTVKKLWGLYKALRIQSNPVDKAPQVGAREKGKRATKARRVKPEYHYKMGLYLHSIVAHLPSTFETGPPPRATSTERPEALFAKAKRLLLNGARDMTRPTTIREFFVRTGAAAVRAVEEHQFPESSHSRLSAAFSQHEFHELSLTFTSNPNLSALLTHLSSFGFSETQDWQADGDTITFITLQDTLTCFKQSPVFV
jgi:hypothetical protein